ncbi:neuropathy target esterase sws [Ixodes scapularis]|uniref:neuropathy target esterase sws n=1 Tax=Ixodes scapularis TaxID=6945 RepID=UPI0011618649|nr:neuropathy target esterase sws [Ixodes scapularis]
MSSMLEHFEDLCFNTPYWEYWDHVVHSSFPLVLRHLYEHHLVTICSLALVVLAVVLGVVLFFRKIKSRVDRVRAQMLGSSRPRFRKRDKVLFYGRKMLRKVNFLTDQASSGRTRLRKRQMVLRFAKKLLRLKREQPLTLQVKEPSQAFLEEDYTEQMEKRLPPDVLYMLRSVRVFGFFEKPVFMELWKHIETIFVPRGTMLFSLGDSDDSIYVVQSGRIHVHIVEPDGTELTFKEVTAGENIASLLSALVVLTGVPSTFKTVAARALEDSSVLRLRYDNFKILLTKYPDSMVRLCQIVMIRLHRVTFTALHNYLGLTTQLMRTTAPAKRAPNLSPKSSPSRASSRKTSQASGFVMAPVSMASFPGEMVHHEDPLHESASLPDTGSFHLSDEITETEKYPSEEVCGSIYRTQPPTTAAPVGRKTSLSSEGTSARKPPRKTSFYLGESARASCSSAQEYRDHLEEAVQGFMARLDIQDSELIRTKVLVKELMPGEYLSKEESGEPASLCFILAGAISVSQKTTAKDTDDILYVAHVGDMTGALEVLTGESPIFTRRAKMPTRVGMIASTHCYEILRLNPNAVLHIARTVIERLSPFVRQIDFALEWMYIESGRAIYRQDEKAESTCIVLSGRLRSVLTRADGKKEMVGEYGRGDLVGVVELLTGAKRATTVMAVRDTELAKLPEGLLNVIKIKYPVVVTRLIHLLGHRLLGSLQRGDKVTAASMISRPSGSNFTTIAVLAVNEDVPLSTFTLELCHALRSIGSVFRLTSELIRRQLGPSALDTANEYRLCNWLGQQEDRHKVLLYQCDSHMSSWTQRCIRQADCILIVALADQEPLVGQLEKQAESIAHRTQKELVLLHREGADKPRNTVAWLNMRSWCSSHHHMRCPKRMFTRRSPSRILEVYKKVEEGVVNVHSDFARLARFLTGTSIGLVLGGGGARGCAHVGMIRAIYEAGIPIDMVGGVSIGSLVGALWCQEVNVTTLVQKGRHWSKKMTSPWRQLWDLTYPITAWFTGAAFNQTIYDLFGERQVEDLWLPYFTVTTDITSSCMRIHRHGSLWRYIRASMSLSGYMPPMCDPMDGHLLLDGGYVNNLPADIMREMMGAETIIAVDVGSQDETDLTNYGDSLSGWWLLFKRWNPLAKSVKIPSLPEIQSRLAYVSCVRQLEEVKSSDYCQYVRPPIDRYKTLQFGSFNEIMEVGYVHGRTLFAGMKAGQHTLRSVLNLDGTSTVQAGKEGRPTTFTDLAEMVCAIKQPYKGQPSYPGSDEEDDYDYSEQEFVTDTDKDEEMEELLNANSPNDAVLAQS